MSEQRPPDLQRLRHVGGQMLLSRDFRDQAAYDAELLAWHQRALHDAYGVHDGLGCTLTGDIVAVSPGLAFDGYGRALQIARLRRLPLPATKRAVLLVIRHGAADAAELAWVEPRAPAARTGVPLATFDPESVALRRTVLRRATTRVLARPRIGSGATPSAGTAWEPWTLAAQRRRPLGLQVRVDTAAAGFTERPCYFAWLVWPDVASARVRAQVYLDLATQYVQDESADGFTFRVVLGSAGRWKQSAGEGAITLARTQRLHVAWLGLQVEDRGRVDERKGDDGPLR